MRRASRQGSECQVRLKPQHADLYRGILPGEWVPAWAMAERLLALAKEKCVLVWDRHHFETRGRAGRPLELRALHTPRGPDPIALDSQKLAAVMLPVETRRS
jgi:hypothetical protein